MITLRQFFIGLTALTALVVVAAYSVYEMTPEHRGRRVVSRIKRLYDEFLEDPEREIRDEYYRKRGGELADDLFDVACHCEPPVHRTRPLFASWWQSSGNHKEGCLYFELFKEFTDYWKRKWKEERARRAQEESRR